MVYLGLIVVDVNIVRYVEAFMRLMSSFPQVRGQMAAQEYSEFCWMELICVGTIRMLTLRAWTRKFGTRKKLKLKLRYLKMI